jgi:hypothetical protein
MFLARVTGSVVSTQKVASMTGFKLLTVEPYRVEPAQEARLVSTGRDRVTKVWDMNGTAQKSFQAHPDVGLRAAFSHDSAKVYAGDWTGLCKDSISPTPSFWFKRQRTRRTLRSSSMRRRRT